MKRQELVQGMAQVGYFPVASSHVESGKGYERVYHFQNKVGKTWDGTNKVLSQAIQNLKDQKFIK